MIVIAVDIDNSMNTTVANNAVKLQDCSTGDVFTMYGSPEALKALAIKILEHHSGYGKDVARIEAQEALNAELEQAVGSPAA